MSNTSPTHAVATLTTPDAVEQTLNQLKSSGFPLEQVSVIGKDANSTPVPQEVTVSNQVGEQSIGSPKGAVVDAVNLATWGAVLVAGGAFVVPGVGPFLALGSIGAALVTGLTGAGLSTVQIFNLQKAMTELGVNEDHARFYVDRLLMGEYLIFLNGEEAQLSQAQTVLQQAGVQNWSSW